MIRKPKLLIINPNQFGYSAGYHYYTKYLKKKYNVTFICLDHGLPKLHEEEVKIIYISNTNNKILRLYSFISQAIIHSRKQKYDVVFTVYFNFVQLIGLFVKADQKILDIRTGSLSDNKIKRNLLNFVFSKSSVCFDKVTVLSQSLAKLLSLPTRKTTILPLGADILHDGLKNYQKMHLIYVGTFYKRNLEKTVIGFSKFYDEFKDIIPIKYYIIGHGRESDEELLISTIKEQNLQEIVIFLGRKNHSQIKNYFEDSSVGISFVPQSIYYDVQPPTKIFEYALSGLITISTDTIESRKLISSENGIICQDNPESFYNALRILYKNIGSYSEEKIRDSLIDYKWETIVDQILIPTLIKKNICLHPNLS